MEGVSSMSMIERILYWIAIVVLVIGIFGLKMHLSELEQKAQQTIEAPSSHAEEDTE